MPEVVVLVYPVSFVLESGPSRLVTLGNADGSPLSRRARGDAEQTARALLEEVLMKLSAGSPDGSTAELRRLGGRYLTAAGVDCSDGRVQLVFTSPVPIPFAEDELDISAGSSYSWHPISGSRGRYLRGDRPERRTGPDAIVLDFWRQAFEETDMALDFLPEQLSLHQLRNLYDAVWGYEQDPSGFKRWAIDRRGAFQGLLDEVAPTDDTFFAALGQQLPSEQAALAGAMSRGSLASLPAELRLPVAVAAATTVNRLWRRRGPEPMWFRKSAAWRLGPTWIENLYPPRPRWTRWETE